MVDWSQFGTESDAAEWLIENGKTHSFAEARKYMSQNIPKESYYQDKIIKHIKQLIPTAFVWKAAAGPYSRKGIPDVCAVIHGRYYGFEVKRPILGALSKIQEQTIKKIREAGGKAYVVTFTKEVTKLLYDEILETATEGKSTRPREVRS